MAREQRYWDPERKEWRTMLIPDEITCVHPTEETIKQWGKDNRVTLSRKLRLQEMRRKYGKKTRVSPSS